MCYCNNNNNNNNNSSLKFSFLSKSDNEKNSILTPKKAKNKTRKSNTKVTENHVLDTLKQHKRSKQHKTKKNSKKREIIAKNKDNSSDSKESHSNVHSAIISQHEYDHSCS
jgi:hypothetical protein